jgi:P27 family predicted phage terminase small subunit
MAGRRPKPLAIHQLNGNPRHFSQADLKGDENPAPPIGVPEMPKGLSKAAKREWKRIVPELMSLGVLSVVDGKALASYCEFYALWETARNQYLKEGITFIQHYEDKEGNLIAGDMKPHPCVAIANNAAKTMKSFLIEFGLTPASRSKLKIAKKDDGDAMDQYLKGKKPTGGNNSPLPFTIDPALMEAE